MNRRVYFIQADVGGPIKIGVAQDLRSRLSTLQTSSSAKLILLAHMPGYEPEEYALHQKLAAYRIRGEWFQPHPDVLAEVARASEHDQIIPRAYIPKSPEQLDRAERTEKFLRSTFVCAIKFAFGDNPVASEIAELVGVTERAVRNWLNEESTPYLVQAINFARQCDAIKYWWVMCTAAGVVAARCDITEYEAVKVLRDNASLAISIMSASTNEQSFPSIDAAYAAYLSTKDLPLWGAE